MMRPLGAYRRVDWRRLAIGEQILRIPPRKARQELSTNGFWNILLFFLTLPEATITKN